MTYDGLAVTTNAATPHLGGSIQAGDPFTWCPLIWDYLIARFGIASAMDVGSGCGNAALYFHRKGLPTIAIEGLEASVRTSLYPAIQHDLTTGPFKTQVDLVHCQEVVEHIEEIYLENLLQTLLTGRIIAMTHALPGADGYHHVNLKEESYWVAHMQQRGAVLLVEDTRRIRELARREGAHYMSQSGLIFANKNRP